MNLVNTHNQTIVRTVGMTNAFLTTIESADGSEVVFAQPSASEDQAVATHNEILAYVKAGTMGHFSTVVDDGA